MVIMQGDCRLIFIELTQKGSPLTPEQLDDVEVCVGSKMLRLTRSGGQVSWSTEKNKWAVRLTQEATFGLSKGEHKVLVRVKYKNKPHFDVRGICVGSVTVVPSYSEEVL